MKNTNVKRIVLVALLIAVVSVVSVFAQKIGTHSWPSSGWIPSYENGAINGITVTSVEGWGSPITVTYSNSFRYGKVEFTLEVYEVKYTKAGTLESEKLVKKVTNTEYFSVLSGDQYSIKFNTGLSGGSYNFVIVVKNINAK